MTTNKPICKSQLIYTTATLPNKMPITYTNRQFSCKFLPFLFLLYESSLRASLHLRQSKQWTKATPELVYLSESGLVLHRKRVSERVRETVHDITLIHPPMENWPKRNSGFIAVRLFAFHLRFSFKLQITFQSPTCYHQLFNLFSSELCQGKVELTKQRSHKRKFLMTLTNNRTNWIYGVVWHIAKHRY